MANLSGQTIQSTYPGLLNLATATTGITSTPQQIQDGLGNNTGTKIATDWLTNPMVLGMKDYKADYYGLGFTVNAGVPVASTQNVMIAQMFYDNGTYDYSAMTYNVITATTSSDVVTCGFYTGQYVDGVGFAPFQLITRIAAQQVFDEINFMCAWLPTRAASKMVFWSLRNGPMPFKFQCREGRKGGKRKKPERVAQA